jgi:hypothetical protein
MEHAYWPVSAPYLVYMGLNLLVCDLTSGTTAGVVMVPVTKTAEGSGGNVGGDADLMASTVAVPDGYKSNFGSLNGFAG